MDCLKAIEIRRSIRKYLPREVPEKLLKRLIDAGRLAPTGGNMQPWEFVLVREKERIKRVVDATFIGFSSDSPHKQGWLETAPVLLIVCTDYKRTEARYGKMGRKVALMDTAAAVENILLAAAALDLGSCWVSGFREEELAELLGLPEGIEATAVIPLGYFEKNPPAPSKFPVEDLTHYERYGNLK